MSCVLKPLPLLRGSQRRNYNAGQEAPFLKEPYQLHIRVTHMKSNIENVDHKLFSEQETDRQSNSA